MEGLLSDNDSLYDSDITPPKPSKFRKKKRMVIDSSDEDDDDEIDDLERPAPPRPRPSLVRDSFDEEEEDIIEDTCGDRRDVEDDEDEIPIRAFDLPQSESLKDLTKDEAAEFILNNTTPELMLECLADDENVRNNEMAQTAVEEINTGLEEERIPSPQYAVSSPQSSRRRSYQQSPEPYISASPAYIPASPAYAPASPAYVSPKRSSKRRTSHKKKSRSPSRSSEGVELSKKAKSMIDAYKKKKKQMDKYYDKGEEVPNSLERAFEKLTDKLEAELDKLGTDIYDLGLSFGKKINSSKFNFGDTSKAMSLSSHLYGIQQAPPNYVGANQMVWPRGMPLGNYPEPNLMNLPRNYLGPGGGNPKGIPPQNPKKFRAVQTQIAFGRRHRRRSRGTPTHLKKYTNRMKELGRRYRNGEFGNQSWKSVVKTHMKKGSGSRKRSRRRSKRRTMYEEDIPRRRHSKRRRRKKKSKRRKSRRSRRNGDLDIKVYYKRGNRPMQRYEMDPLSSAYYGYPHY